MLKILNLKICHVYIFLIYVWVLFNKFVFLIILYRFHPYQYVMFRARRARYYKVERSVRGFYVQDFVRKEVINYIYLIITGGGKKYGWLLD